MCNGELENFWTERSSHQVWYQIWGQCSIEFSQLSSTGSATRAGLYKTKEMEDLFAERVIEKGPLKASDQGQPIIPPKK